MKKHLHERSFLRRIRAKLKARRGEALAEILVALAISAVGMVLLAGMIMSSADMIKTSKDKMDDYIKAQNSIVQQETSELTGTVTFNRTIEDEGTETITAFVLTDEWKDLGGDPVELTVHYFVNSEIGGKSVVSYRAQGDGEGGSGT